MEESAVGLLVWAGVALVVVSLVVRFAVRLMLRLLLVGALALGAVLWLAWSVGSGG